MEVKDIIKKRREELNLTYEQLGNMIGVGKSTVRKWETGMIENMRRDNIVALSKALNISPAIIMGWETIDNDSNNSLSQQETTLLENYNKLNSKGKEKLLDYSDDLTTNIKYMNNTDNEISATKDNVIEFNNKKDDEEVFVPYKSFDELGAKCNAAHADDLTPEKLEHAKQVILEAENEFKLAEWNKKHNK